MGDLNSMPERPERLHGQINPNHDKALPTSIYSMYRLASPLSNRSPSPSHLGSARGKGIRINLQSRGHRCDAAGFWILIYKMFTIQRSTLSLQRRSDFPHYFFPHFLAMLRPIQKTTITRFVHILAAVDRAYWEHNSDELAAIDPMSLVANLQFLPPTATQRASDHMMSAGDSTLEYSCNRGLGSLNPMAPMEATADRWSATSNIVSRSMDPLAMPAWHEEREVRLPQPGASYN